MAKVKRNRIEKRCEKCGTVVLARARERRCKRRQFGPNSYCCWGHLKRVKTARPARKVRPSATNVDSAVQQHVAKERPQDVARRKLEHARAQQKRAASKIKRATTSMQLWQKRAERYARLASMTDEEHLAMMTVVRAQREERASRRLTRRRSIDLT